MPLNKEIETETESNRLSYIRTRLLRCSSDNTTGTLKISLCLNLLITRIIDKVSKKKNYYQCLACFRVYHLHTFT